MATTTHYIYSDYNPEDRERIEAETGQLPQDSDDFDPWLTEKAFGSSQRLKHPPKFVAATAKYDPWIEPIPHALPRGKAEEPQSDVASWYKQLTSAGNSQSNTPKAGPSRTLTPIPSHQSSGSNSSKATSHDKSTWFINRVLEAQLASGEVRPTSSSSSTPTLADLLSREPPPKPSQKPFEPPVWIALGPSNKGFDMLQRSGWEEGEALGKFAVRRGGLGFKPKSEVNSDTVPFSQTSEKVLGKRKELVREVTVSTSQEDVEEIKRVDVIDLTLTDDDNSDDADDTYTRNVTTSQGLLQHDVATDIDHNARALLTPLPTILKSDRLGIGLKAKTVGPYRESVKKVTHSQAALGAHAAANENRKRTKMIVGRGKRGFDRVHKKEEGMRKKFLADLNAD
jgi:hypothetical protein